MMSIHMGRATPRPLTRQSRGGVTGWTMDALVGVLPAGTTFTRASGGTYFGSDGLLKTASTNVPRFDYNPVTLAPRGLLIEGQRTNLLLWNRDLTNAAWTKTNVTAALTATGIDGASNSASRLEATSNNGTVLQSVTSGNTARATTAYVRRVSGTGTVEMTQNGGTDWTAITLTSSWQRFGPASAAVTNPSVGFRLGTSGDVIEVDYVQLENAAIASSAIATQGSSVTRSADFPVNIPAEAIGFNPAGGTFLYEVEYRPGHESNCVGRMTSNAVNNTLILGEAGRHLSAPTGRNLVFYRNASNEQIALLRGTNDLRTEGIVRIATSYRDGRYTAANTGSDFASGSSGSGLVPTGIERLLLGASQGNTNHLNGWLRRVVYWPYVLPDGQQIQLVQ